MSVLEKDLDPNVKIGIPLPMDHVDGSGFFQILIPDGRIGYTRAGVFGKNAEGLLTNPSGFVVQPEIEIPEGVTSLTYHLMVLSQYKYQVRLMLRK